MPHRVCPWWLGYWLLCPVRRLLVNPRETLSPHVSEGMTVLEPGPGMGYFTLELARLAGPSGRVIAVDIQPRMIERLKQRASKAKLSDRIDARVVSADSMGIADLRNAVNLTFAFAVVHELPDAGRFFAETAAASKPGAALLLVEPKGHVKLSTFESEVQAATEAHFEVVDRPFIHSSHAVLLRKHTPSTD